MNTNKELCLTVLTIWSWSLLQFTFVLTSSKVSYLFITAVFTFYLVQVLLTIHLCSHLIQGELSLCHCSIHHPVLVLITVHLFPNFIQGELSVHHCSPHHLVLVLVTVHLCPHLIQGELSLRHCNRLVLVFVRVHLCPHLI